MYRCTKSRYSRIRMCKYDQQVRKPFRNSVQVLSMDQRNSQAKKQTEIDKSKLNPRQIIR